MKTTVLLNILLLIIILIQGRITMDEATEEAIKGCFIHTQQNKEFADIKGLYDEYGTVYDALDDSLKEGFKFITLKREMTGNAFWFAKDMDTGEGEREIGKTMLKENRIARNSKDLFQLIGTANLLGIFKPGEELKAYHLQTVCRSLATMLIAEELYENTHKDSANYGDKEKALIMFTALSSDIAMPNTYESKVPADMTSNYFSNLEANWEVFKLKLSTRSQESFQTNILANIQNLKKNDWPQLLQITYFVSHMIYELIFFEYIEDQGEQKLFTNSIGTYFKFATMKSFNIEFTSKLAQENREYYLSSDHAFLKMAKDYHKYPDHVVILANMMCMSFKDDQLKAYMVDTLLKLKLNEQINFGSVDNLERHQKRALLLNTEELNSLDSLLSFYPEYSRSAILTEDRIYADSSDSVIQIMEDVDAQNHFKDNGGNISVIINDLVSKEDRNIHSDRISLPTIDEKNMNNWLDNSSNVNKDEIIDKIPHREAIEQYFTARVRILI